MRRTIGTVLAALLVASLLTAVGATTGLGASPARADSLVATLDVATNPTDIAIDATGSFGYLAGCDPHTGIVAQVIRIDLATFTIDDTLPLPSDGTCVRAVALVDDSLLFTTDYHLYRVDAATFGPNLDDSVAIRDLGVDIAVHGSHAYITHMTSDRVSKVDISGPALAFDFEFLSGGSWPMGIAIEPTGVYGYVVNAITDSLAKIRLSDGVTVATLATGNQSYGIKIDRAGAHAYVPAAIPDAGQSYPWLVRVDLATFTVDDTVDLPFTWGFDVALTPDGAFAYVGESRSGNPGRIAKIGLGANMTLIETISSNPGSHALTTDPTGTFVYSADYNDHNQTTVSKVVISAGPPTVTGLSVVEGPLAGGGTTVIAGTNFTGVTGVSFGGTAATVLSSSDDTIAVTVPAAGSAGSVNVTVTTGAGTSSQTVPFTYVAAPVVTSMTPDSGPIAGGTAVTITGTELSSATVDIDGAAVATTTNTATTIEFTTPPTAAGAATITVTTTGGAISAGTFTFIDPSPLPAIPPSAPGSPSVVPGDGSASVSWAEPDTVGSFPISTYQVRVSPGGHTCLTAQTSCEITGLDHGTDYTFAVRALSGAGWSDFSLPTSARTADPATIVITGTRKGKKLLITGVATGVDMSSSLTPWSHRSGRSGKSPKVIEGRAISMESDGSFTWSRRASARMTWRIHITTDTGLASNTLTFR